MTPAFVGCDPATKHGAAVVLSEDGRLEHFWYYTTVKRAVVDLPKRLPGLGFRVPPELDSGGDPEERHIRLLLWLAALWSDVLAAAVGEHEACVALESYAFGKHTAAYDMAEVGTIVRMTALCHRGVRLRLHGPSRLKMAATNNGTADKVVVLDAVRDRLGIDWRGVSVLPANVQEDLADATVLANLVRLEWLVRKDPTKASLLSEGEARAFNAVSKSQPLALLARNWIRCGEP